MTEQGAHDGKLSADLLDQAGPGPGWHHWIVEPNPVFRDAQSSRLGDRVRLSTSPLSLGDTGPLEGVFLCNELLDAFPVRRLRYELGRWRELRVVPRGDSLTEQPFDLEPDEIAQWPWIPRAAAEGFHTEVCEEIGPWLDDLSTALIRGVALIIDYGGSAREAFLPERADGSIRGFRAHRPVSDPFAALRVTPSMRATAKYFWVVLALFLAQILLGAITAHYQVEGQEAYGFQLSQYLPYSLSRTWHTQLAGLWIAVAWLATGLYIAPALSGHEPKFQRLGVNFLFVSLLIIVVGSFAGQWLAVMQKLGLENNFWFGHQGWEYADMGRFWQWYLFIGLLLWLGLVGRALWPVLRGPTTETKSIIALMFLSTVAIGLF
ncbi:MAG: SAM-dependent methyltransferase, partial [Verrucomicrobiales bacterium]